LTNNSGKNEIEDKDIVEFIQKKNIFFTPELIKEISQQIPITSEEIFSSESRSQIAADQTIFYLGKIIGKFIDEKELNIAINLLMVLQEISIYHEIITEEHILQAFFQKKTSRDNIEIEKIRVKGILKILSGSSIFHPIQKTYSGLIINKIGLLLLDYYQKMKSELLIIFKNEKLGPLFEIYLNFRTLMNFEGQNLQVDWIHAALINLRRMKEHIEKVGEIFHEDLESSKEIENIQRILEEIQKYQKLNLYSKKFTIKDHHRFAEEIMETIGWLVRFFRRDHKFHMFKSKDQVFGSPFNEMSNHIINNWDKFNWDEIYFTNSHSFIPVKMIKTIGVQILESVILKYLLKSTKEQVKDLPIGAPPELSKRIQSDIKVKDEEFLTLRDEIKKKLYNFVGKTDFELSNHHDLLHLLRRLSITHELCFLKHFEINKEIEWKNDKLLNITRYSARKINKLLKKVK